MVLSTILKTEAIIFDMDGTLLDTISDISSSVNSILKKYKFPQHSYEQYKVFIGNGIESLIKKALPVDFKGNYNNIFKEIESEYKSNLNKKTIIYDGIIDLLEYLVFKNIKIGICTNKPHKHAIKCVNKYFKNFNFEIIGAGHSFPLKPNPKGILNIINKFKVESSKCLFVGDSGIDIFTAKNANILSVGALWGFRSKKELSNAGADFLFKNPLDFLIFLKKNL
tara:strand:- start:165 stop:836 length:672 start_codon:yes stop_codon:yes gene_type:complete